MIVGDNYEHECLTPILTKFGKKLVRLLVCKKREIELYCDKKLTPRPVRTFSKPAPTFSHPLYRRLCCGSRIVTWP